MSDPSFIEVFEKIEGRFSKTSENEVSLTSVEWMIIKEYLGIEPTINEQIDGSFDDAIDDLKKEITGDD